MTLRPPLVLLLAAATIALMRCARHLVLFCLTVHTCLCSPAHDASGLCRVLPENDAVAMQPVMPQTPVIFISSFSACFLFV